MRRRGRVRPGRGLAQTQGPGAILTDPVEVNLTPDLWVLSFRTSDRLQGQQIDKQLPFGKIVDQLQSVFLGEVIVRKGPLVLLADVNYANLDLRGGDLPPMIDRIGVEGTWASFGASYTLQHRFSLGSRPLLLRVEPGAAAVYTTIEVRPRTANGMTVMDLDKG